MHSSAQAEHNYTFGKVKFEVSVDGNVDNADSVVNHLLATVTSVEGIETIQFGLTDGQMNGDKHQQECNATVTFGEITISAKLSFDLKRHTSNRTLNTIVFGVLLPKILQTAGIYLGEGPTPGFQAQMPHGELVSRIDSLLRIAPADIGNAYDQPLDQSSNGRRQVVTR
jgi:hypothetical protein